MAKKTSKNDNQDSELSQEPLKQDKPGDYAKSTSQMDDAVKGPAAGGVKHGVTETDENGNFTGRGATSNRANDPLVNRDAVSPKIQNEKPETNVERSVPQDGSVGADEPDNGNWDMRVVPPYDQEGSKDVTENYKKVKEESLHDDPVATMGRQSNEDGDKKNQK